MTAQPAQHVELFTNSAAASASNPIPALLVSGTGALGSVSVSSLPAGVLAGMTSLPAGTSAIGKLASNSGVNIGTVDVNSITAGETHLGEVGGKAVMVQSTFTRPNDATAYAVNDVVANSASSPSLMTFTNVARINGQAGTITKLRFLTDQAANVAQYRLHLYHTQPTAINDNAPYTSLWANASSQVGYLDVGPVAQEGAGSTAALGLNTTDLLPFVCASGDRNLYGILATKTAFTPATGQQFYCELTADLN